MSCSRCSAEIILLPSLSSRTLFSLGLRGPRDEREDEGTTFSAPFAPCRVDTYRSCSTGVLGYIGVAWDWRKEKNRWLCFMVLHCNRSGPLLCVGLLALELACKLCMGLRGLSRENAGHVCIVIYAIFASDANSYFTAFYLSRDIFFRKMYVLCSHWILKLWIGQLDLIFRVSRVNICEHTGMSINSAPYMLK